MSAPQALIEFFQQEAIEYLDRLDQLLAASENACPEATAFLTHARALRGSATMTRLEALPDLAATIERIAAGLRDNELRWDQRLHFAVHGALVELRDLVGHANNWTDAEQRRSRTQSVTLAAIAAGYLAAQPLSTAQSTPVVPISRFFPDDGLPGILERNPNPPFTLPQRFRSDIAAGGSAIARELVSLFPSENLSGAASSSDALRRALLTVSAVADSYGATSIAALAVTMARAPLESSSERAAVQSLAHLMQDQDRTDQELAARIKDATLTWPGRRTPAMAQTPSAASRLEAVGSTAGQNASGRTNAIPQIDTSRAPTPVAPTLIIRDMPAPRATPAPTQQTPLAAPAIKAKTDSSGIVPISSLLYSGPGALARAREVRDELRAAWSERGGVAADPKTSALLDELSDLLDLAVAG